MRADLVAPPEKPALSDLTRVDALGYDCIREEDIDLAFHATGKGMRLPRTCLPKPCEAALTPVQLAGLIGRNPYQREWDDYFSRYADFCRKEVVPFGKGRDVASAGSDAVAFWAPLAASYPVNAPIRSNLLGISGFGIAGLPSYPTEGPGSSGTPLRTGFNVPAAPSTDYPVEVPDPDQPPSDPVSNTPPDTPLPVVPVPAAWMLLLTGAVCLWSRRCIGPA